LDGDALSLQFPQIFPIAHRLFRLDAGVEGAAASDVSGRYEGHGRKTEPAQPRKRDITDRTVAIIERKEHRPVRQSFRRPESIEKGGNVDRGPAAFLEDLQVADKGLFRYVNQLFQPPGPGSPILWKESTASTRSILTYSRLAGIAALLFKAVLTQGFSQDAFHHLPGIEVLLRQFRGQAQ
jgi:hypothetical protein